MEPSGFLLDGSVFLNAAALTPLLDLAFAAHLCDGG